MHYASMLPREATCEQEIQVVVDQLNALANLLLLPLI